MAKHGIMTSISPTKKRKDSKGTYIQVRGGGKFIWLLLKNSLVSQPWLSASSSEFSIKQGANALLPSASASDLKNFILDHPFNAGKKDEIFVVNL